MWQQMAAICSVQTSTVVHDCCRGDASGMAPPTFAQSGAGGQGLPASKILLSHGCYNSPPIIHRFPPNFVRQLSNKARRNCSNIGLAQVVSASATHSTPAKSFVKDEPDACGVPVAETEALATSVDNGKFTSTRSTHAGDRTELVDPQQGAAAVNVDKLLGQKTPLHELSSSLALSLLPPSNLQFSQMGPIDQAFFLLGFIACVSAGALSALLFTAIPTLNAMRRAAIAMEKLADVARDELPPTMAAIRLSGMEISDLTLELNDLRYDLPNANMPTSHEISDGVRSSARAVHAAEVGIRRMGAVAATQTLAMLQEQAKYPVAVVKPAVMGAAETTRQAIDHARKVVIQLATHPNITGWLGRGKKGNQADSSDDNLSDRRGEEIGAEKSPNAATSSVLEN